MGSNSQISVDRVGDVFVAIIEGVVADGDVPELEKKLSKLHGKVAVDCSEIFSLSERGLKLFLEMAKRAEASREKCLFFGLRDELLEEIQLAGFTKVLKVFGTKEEALRACG